MYKKWTVSLLLVMLTLLAVNSAGAQGDDGLIRLVHLVPDSDPLDVFIDGERLLEDLRYNVISHHLTLQPGSHTVALAPAGSSINRAIIGPVKLTIVGGSSYIVAAIGAMEDESVTSVTIDETATFRAAELDKSGEQSIFLNAVPGSGEVDIYFGAEQIVRRLGFGEYEALNIPLETFSLRVVEAGFLDERVLLESDTYGFPNNTSLLALNGFSFEAFDLFVSNYSPLDIISYLDGYSDHPEISFNTLLDAFDRAGLTEELASGEGVTIFAPSDNAFNRLPEDTLEKLLDDRRTLANLLRYHMVPELLLFSDLVDRLDTETGEIRLVSLQGGEIVLRVDNDAGLLINESVAFDSYTDYLARNGNAFIIDGVLQFSGSPGNTVSLPDLFHAILS
jgi:uncharacterized surface protein with fasciclin (FAS1) repeats